jgi:membrane protein DedA with SNARE-associated domain
MGYFFHHLDEYVIRWVSHGGYPVLFGLLFSCGLGMPLPEDIPLLAAGFMIWQGHFNPVLAGIFAWCGIIGGDCVLYHLGKRYGLKVTELPLIGRHLSLSRILWVEHRFKRHGIWVVAIGRMFAGVRGAMVVCAGAIRFPFWKFVITDGVAAIFSGGLFIVLGYYFGKNMDMLRTEVAKGKRFAMLAVLALAAGIGIWVWIHKKLSHATGEHADAVSASSETPAPPSN